MHLRPLFVVHGLSQSQETRVLVIVFGREKGIPYLVGHSMVQDEQLHPVGSSSALLLATAYVIYPPSGGRESEERRTGRTRKRRRGARLDQNHRRHRESLALSPGAGGSDLVTPRLGYVLGLLAGLLTGLPPFITAGSVVLLLGGTAAFGTVSPTSCNDGSLYIATAREKKWGEEDAIRYILFFLIIKQSRALTI